MAKGKKTSETENKRTEGASFKFDPEVLHKLRYIAFKERITQTDIVEDACKDYIAKYEKKNGPIPVK